MERGLCEPKPGYHRRMKWRTLSGAMAFLGATACFALLALRLAIGAPRDDWPLFNDDAARSGSNDDSALRPANVAHLGLRWRVRLGSVVDAAPIVVGDRIFLTGKDGTTDALSTRDGHVLWRFATHGPNITTSVPAYDPSGPALYVPGVDGFIHRLDPGSGRERRGTGFPAQLTLAPQTEKDASALNLANGYLYAQTSGYIGDATPYVGHVVAIRLSDGVAHVFDTLCSSEHRLIQPQSCPDQRAGMWSRSGVVVDPDPAQRGRIYAVTGNAPFRPAGGAYGDSILALDGAATQLLQSFTPSNYDELEADDLDLGSSSPALLPRQAGSATPLLLVQGGKDGVLRLLDRTHLGGLDAPLQSIPLGNQLFSAPAVWNDPNGTTWIFIDLLDGVHAYQVRTTNRQTRLMTAWRANVTSTEEGTSPVVAAGTVFVAGAGALVALDARSGRQLWSHSLGAIHWQSPSVANGSVYCADQSGDLSAFGADSLR